MAKFDSVCRRYYGAEARITGIQSIWRLIDAATLNCEMRGGMPFTFMSIFLHILADIWPPSLTHEATGSSGNRKNREQHTESLAENCLRSLIQGTQDIEESVLKAPRLLDF
jgi:hypothetical protein